MNQVIAQNKPILSKEEKINIFMSLFRGRTDVFARRWEFQDGGKSGYSPVYKDKAKSEYAALNQYYIEEHLRGNRTIGIYPILKENTSWFVAADFELMQILQDFISDLADSPAPIAIKIFGRDPVILKDLSKKVGGILESVTGVVDINMHIRPSATEETVEVDPTLANKFGLSISDVLTQVKAALLGIIVTSVREEEKLIPIRVRLLDTSRKYFNEHLSSLPISNVSGNILPLGAIAKIESKAGNIEIRRENLARLGFVTGHLENRDLGSAMKDVQAKISNLKLPASYYISYGGQWANQQTAFLNLLLVMGLAILLVYLILVFQFHSLLTPIPILIAIPLSLFGAIFGLLITHTPLNISSFMGVILLVGLVVKNGIIFLAYSQQALSEGKTLDLALIEAGKLRLRPILMTTICTLLGLFPLALGIGAGAELQKPLAITVISGLSFSTLITLLITPTFFKLIENVKQYFQKKTDARI